MRDYQVKTFRQVVLCSLVIVCCAFPLACHTDRGGREREESNLKPLAILYGQYVGQHQGRPPRSEEAFKEYIRSLPSETLESLTVTDPDSLFVSSRDGQPYVVIYGEAKGPAGPGGSPVVMYEQQGVRGKRFVASTLGAIEEVDEARFKELVPGAP